MDESTQVAKLFYVWSKFFCEIYRKKWGCSVYASDGSKKFKMSAFTDHYRWNEHHMLVWACTNREKTINRAIFIGQCVCDKTLQTIFKAIYFTKERSLSYSKFHALCKLLMYVNILITSSMYQDEKNCSDLIKCISVVIQKKIMCRIRNSSFFGIMIDKSTNISVTGHLVIFATIIKEGCPKLFSRTPTVEWW